MDSNLVNQHTTNMGVYKVYVAVFVRFDSQGGMRPKYLEWQDGTRYQITKTKFIEKAPSRCGGINLIRYTVIIENKQRYLFFEKDLERWFVEKES